MLEDFEQNIELLKKLLSDAMTVCFFIYQNFNLLFLFSKYLLD
jgi:hypothetical protein